MNLEAEYGIWTSRLDSRFEIWVGNILDVGLGLPVGTFGIRISEFRIYCDWEFYLGNVLVFFILCFFDLDLNNYILLFFVLFLIFYVIVL